MRTLLAAAVLLSSLAAGSAATAPPALQSQSKQFNATENSDQPYMCPAGHLQSALAVSPAGTLLNIDLVDSASKVIPFGTWGSAQGFKLSSKTAIPVRIFMTCGN